MEQGGKPIVYVGVDWAKEKHQVCAIDAGGRVLGERVVPHRAAALAEMCRWLAKLAGGAPPTVWVGIEVPHGAVVETLLEGGFIVHSLNPKQMDRFRDRFTVAGAKDDRRDARVLADSLRTDPQCYRRLQPEEPLVIELREHSRMGLELKQERTRLVNRLQGQLVRYYPQFLEVANDFDAEWVLDLLELVPTPDQARRVREQTVAKLLRKRRVRKVDATKVLAVLRQPALVVAPGTEAAAVAHLELLVERVRLVNAQLKRCSRRIDALLELLSSPESVESGGARCEQRDVTILRSLPGVGPIVLATLLAEGWWVLVARDYQAWRALSGVAPVTRSSGKKHVVVFRRACNPRLRDAVYHWSRVAVQRDPVCKAAYAGLRARGHGHGRALRSVGDRLLSVACAMLRDGTSYDVTRRQRRPAPELLAA